MGKHLTFEQRCQIEVLLGAGYTQAEIAASVGTSQSAVSRELARNHGQRGYRCKQAHEKAEARRSAASAVPRKMSEAVVAAIEAKLCTEQLSPQQISAWLATTQSVSVSHERIYLHIWADKRAGAACCSSSCGGVARNTIAARPNRRAAALSLVASTSLSGRPLLNSGSGLAIGRPTRSWGLAAGAPY